MKLRSSIFVLALILAGCGGSDAPTADAGEDFTVTVGDAPEFDGCGSEGNMSNYEWTIVEAPNADSNGKALRETMADCSFTLESAMTIDDVGTWTIELTVTADGETSSDQVVVEVVEG